MEELKNYTEEARSYIIKEMIKGQFFTTSTIAQNKTAEEILEFLTMPESINSMIEASKLGLPALAGVVVELEKRFANSTDFPLHHNGPGANSKYRKNIGWMIKYCLKFFGYTPYDRGRVGSFKDANGKKIDIHFASSAIYKQTIPPIYKLVIRFDKA